MSHEKHPSISLSQYHELVSLIYDAALDSKTWRTVLKKIAELTKAEHGSLRILNSDATNIQQSYIHNKDPYFEKLYREYYIKIDPWLNDFANTRNTFISCTHHNISDKEYSKLEFHRGIVEPLNSHYGMGGKIHVNDDLSSFVTLNRGRNREGFEYEYLDAFLTLIPHVKRSLLINAKFSEVEIEQQRLKDTLDKLSSPVLLVNKFGNILFANAPAERILRNQAGVITINNTVALSSHQDSTTLHRLIHLAACGDSDQTQHGNGISYTDPHTQKTLSILVCPVNPDRTNMYLETDSCVLLLLGTNERSTSISSALLKELYNVTPKEARLIEQLCQGLTLDEIAVRFSVSINTVRTQLRSCFNKTGTSRQAELISLIVNGPAGIINLK